MNKWFAAGSDHPFIMFGVSHLVMLFLFGLGVILLLLYKKHLVKGSRAHKIVRWTLLVSLLLSEASYQYWAYAHGLFTTYEYLPLHLCGIASLIGMVSLVTYHKKMIQINFFIGILPAVIALITPEIPHGYEHFRYWKFFLHHMAIPWTGLFLVVTTSVPIHFKVMCETYCYLVLYALAAGIFNSIFHTNYLFLTEPPASFPALKLLDIGLGYQVNLGLLVFGVFYLLLVFYRWTQSRKRSESYGI